jgi:DNA-binding transcriptional MerR regulator
MQKRQFRIGELAKQLNVEKFVIRFWEKEFEVKTIRSTGGQRFYSMKDIEKFKHIKKLLYDQGFTIAGAKQQLKGSPSKAKAIMGSHKTTFDQNEMLHAQLLELKEHLIKLKKLL